MILCHLIIPGYLFDWQEDVIAPPTPALVNLVGMVTDASILTVQEIRTVMNMECVLMMWTLQSAGKCQLK